MEFYSTIIVGLIVSIPVMIGGLFLIKENIPFYGGYLITITCIIVTMILLIYLFNKPDFEPRTLKNFKIRKESEGKINIDIMNWFSENKFKIKKEDSNLFIGTKIINNRVKYIFKISIKENEDNNILYGEFYVLFDYDTNKLSESSLSNKRIVGGSIYIRPAWFLMEDLIKNLQSNQYLLE